MLRKSLILLPFCTALVATGALAQDLTSVGVVRAATGFIRDSLPPGAIVIDSKKLGANSAVADLIAKEMGATRGLSSELVRCEPERPDRLRACTIQNSATLLMFSQPVIRDKSAEITVYWIFQVKPNQIAGRSFKLALGRDAGDKWKVERVLERGAS
jgi:hypothetical protein